MLKIKYFPRLLRPILDLKISLNIFKNHCYFYKQTFDTLIYLFFFISSLFSGIQKTFLPVLWFEQKVSMKPEFADEIASALSVPITGTISFIVIFFIGLLMTFWFTCDALLCKLLKRQQKISHTEQNISIAMLPEKFKESDQKNDIKLVVEQHPLMTVSSESEKQKEADEKFVHR